MTKLITTSWDDGHELDFKVAELLDKYNLKGTFYIPRTNSEHSVMSEKQVQQLAQSFEVGGHTLNHIRLSSTNKIEIDKEVVGSFDWLRNLLGKPPVSFCFPGGVYNSISFNAVLEAGFQFARTTELLSTCSIYNSKLMPTTLQLFNHPRLSYLKNSVKRKKVNNLLGWLAGNSEKDIISLTNYYLQRAESDGGCFHLWGHSWELEEFNLWQKLEEVFKIMAQHTSCTRVQNGEVLNYA